MIKTIYKYELSICDIQDLYLPINYKILAVQTQEEKPVLYCLVDKEVKQKDRVTFEIFGTGHNIDFSNDNKEYIGTFQLRKGQIVFHLFKLHE